jgi:CheY-like chemotaxis protein
VSTAGDGEEGLRVAREKLPQLIVLDMMLPRLSGPELLDALKKDAATKDIPVIVVSSLPKTNEEKLKKLGAAAYFEKAAIGVESGSAGLIRVIEPFFKPTKTAAAASR